MATIQFHPAELHASEERRRLGETLQEEADRYRRSLREFVRGAWPIVVPVPFTDTWHIDAICDHLQAAYEREIPRLVITIQPGALKSTLVSVMAPAWRWAHHPQERIVSASHTEALAMRDTTKSRQLIQSAWYQARFGEEFTLSRDENLKGRYSNTLNGHRIATHVGGGTGERGSCLILDDPHNAQEIQSPTMLKDAREWFGNTWASRLNVNVDDSGVKIVIGQRIHEEDVIGFLLSGDDDSRWTHLCLPARWEKSHPYIYPEKVKLPSGRVLQGDPRKKDGELLAPSYMDEDSLKEVTHEMTSRTVSAQYRQVPTPQEGTLLKRHDWRYYPPELSFYAQRSPFTREAAQALGLEMVVHSWDTSLKDRKTSDYVAGGVWGVKAADRYLLRLFHERAGFNATIEAMAAFYEWAADLWPQLPQYVLIEASANGKDAIAEMKRKLNGVVSITASGTKGMRAEAASPALEGHNCFLPGYPNPEMTDYDARTPTIVQEFVDEAARFDPLTDKQKDDQVDQWSQAMNWIRQRGSRRASFSAPTGTI